MSISWLLFKKSGKQSMGRLGLTAAAIGLGIVLLLSLVAGVNGLKERFNRGSWASISYPTQYSGEAGKKAQAPVEGVAPLQIDGYFNRAHITLWRDKVIRGVSLHKTGANSPEFPGLKTPEPGEYYLSPKLDEIARQHPEDNIGVRFGTKYLGIIPDEYVSSPDKLEVVRGATKEEVSQAREKRPDSYANIYTIPKDLKANVLAFDPITPMMLGFGATILLAPIVMFVAVATRLGSTQREQRYAALRLIGATRGQVNKVLLFESFIATAAGIVLGSIVFMFGRSLLQNVQFSGERFWIEDLNVSLVQYLIFVAITIILSMFASWRAMRKVQTSPLGVVRREKLTKPPRSWRFIPLLLGIGVFVWLSTEGGKSWISENSQSILPMLLLMGAITAVMFGLLLAGPWLTNVLSRLAARSTKRATTLIATKRIKEHSRQVFRSVGGVVLALFAGSFYLAAVSGIGALEQSSVDNNGFRQLQDEAVYVESSHGGFKDSFYDNLRQQPFVSVVAKAYQKSPPDVGNIIRCEDIATFTVHHCPPEVAVSGYAGINFYEKPVKTVTMASKPAAENAVVYLVKLKTTSAIDQLRSFIAENTNQPAASAFAKLGKDASKPVINPIIKDLAAITYIGIGITLFVAVASLIVSTIGGLIERRRSLFTLRLGGMTIQQMKRVVLIESLIPLISVSVLAAGTGIWVASIFLQAVSSTVRVQLSPLYFAIVIGSLAAAVVGIWLVLPMLKRITSLERNQTE